MRWGKSFVPVLAAGVAIILARAEPAAAAPRVLRVLTHSSFSATKTLIEQFERENGVEVRFTAGGDAGETLNKAILAGARPLADVIFGVDNTFMSRALAAGILEPWDSPLLAQVPAELQLDPSRRLLPVDVGHVCLNYDRAFFEKSGLAVPRSLEDLVRPEYRDLLVVENPATSSPGLAFLLATIARFGEKGPVTWETWWTGLRANGVLVVNGWNEAYYDEFSGAGKGRRPLVVSYSTSPAAEVFFAAEPKPAQPPTGVVMAPGSSFRQVEFAGIFRGAREKDLARKFVDFLLSRRFQEDIPLQMFVYPANRTAAVPDLFVRFAPVPPEPAGIDPALIEAHREKWIARWTRLVLR